MPTSFSDLTGACKGLLLTTADVLNRNGVKYVVAGGWVPILSEPNHPSLRHPGTRDVDVLLMDDSPNLQSAVKALLAAQFRPSAKHEFQLLRDAEIMEQQFVFNVDLMHPSEEAGRPEMFSDIFDLGVTDSYDPKGSRFIKSVAFKSAKIVYEQNLFSNISVSGIDLNGNERNVTVPILSPAAAILSKCESVSIKKRTRDSFDIYFLLSGVNGRKHAAELRQLAQRFDQVQVQLRHLELFLTNSSAVFDLNVGKYAGRAIPAAGEVMAALFPRHSNA